MQNIFNKLMDKVGVPSLLVLLALLGVSYGMLLGKNAIINYEYNTFTAPFLQTGVIATHSPSKLATITVPLSVEYISWSPVVAHKTAAKK
jgi:hypothetical protein